jgi:hypothetical protein
MSDFMIHQLADERQTRVGQDVAAARRARRAKSAARARRRRAASSAIEPRGPTYDDAA